MVGKLNKMFGLLQLIFIPLMLLFFICMNIGLVKYNGIITAGSIILFALLGLCLIWKFGKKLPSVSEKMYRFSLLGVFVTFFIIQTLVCLYVPLPYYSDYIVVREQAIAMANDYSILPQFDFYFHIYPFQVSLVAILNLLYELFGSYEGVEIATTALVNMSAIIAGLTVCNLTKNRMVAIFVAIMFNVFSTFCIKTYMPYSANLGMIFPILMLYVYTLNIKRSWKVILLVLVVVIGYRVKMTTIIPFIAMAIFGSYKLLKERDYKTTLVGIIAMLVFSGISVALHNVLLAKMAYTKDVNAERGIIYYFAMGQNNPTGGQYSKDYSILADSLYPMPREERDNYFLEMAIKSIKERDFVGQVKFFASKIAYCWGETRLDHLSVCKYDELLLIFKHFTWYLALTLMTVGAFFIRDVRYYMLLLGIWGVIGYLYLSEAGARYVLMYMPIVYVMAGWTVVEIFKRLKDKRVIKYELISCNTHQ